jgi:hypothetical protein
MFLEPKAAFLEICKYCIRMVGKDARGTPGRLNILLCISSPQHLYRTSKNVSLATAVPVFALGIAALVHMLAEEEQRDQHREVEGDG